MEQTSLIYPLPCSNYLQAVFFGIPVAKRHDEMYLRICVDVGFPLVGYVQGRMLLEASPDAVVPSPFIWAMGVYDPWHHPAYDFDYSRGYRAVCPYLYEGSQVLRPSSGWQPLEPSEGPIYALRNKEGTWASIRLLKDPNVIQPMPVLLAGYVPPKEALDALKTGSAWRGFRWVQVNAEPAPSEFAAGLREGLSAPPPPWPH